MRLGSGPCRYCNSERNDPLDKPGAFVNRTIAASFAANGSSEAETRTACSKCCSFACAVAAFFAGPNH